MSLLQSPQPNRNRGSSISSVASSMLSPITNMLSLPKVDEHNDTDGHVALSSPGTDERKRVELRIGGMTVSLTRACKQTAFKLTSSAAPVLPRSKDR